MPVPHPRRMLSVSRAITVWCSFWNPEYVSAYGSFLPAVKEQLFLFLIELKNSHADSSTTEPGVVCLAADLLKICSSVTIARCANTSVLQLRTATTFILSVTEAAAPPNPSSSSPASLDSSFYFSLNIVICIFFTCPSKIFCIYIRKGMWKREALCPF